MIINWVLYILAFIVSIAIILLILYFTLNSISNKLKGRDIDDVFGSGKLFYILFYATAIVGTFLLFNKVLNYQPPLTKSKTMVSSFQSDESVAKLTYEIQNINSTLSNIDNLTITQIKNELNKTLLFIEKLKEETLNQQRTITMLQNTTVEQRAKAENAINYANKVESLSKEQIEALKILITSDAKKENQSSFWTGVLVSFPIGVLSSLFASLLIRRKKI